MRPGKSEALVAAIIALFFATAAYFYPQMPERIASHWNAQGQADGYTSKLWGVFLMPIISLGLAALLLLLPRIDPMKANIEKFKKHYVGFVVIIILFLFYLHLLTIFWNLGYRFNMLQLLMPAFGILYYFIGVMVQKAKRNYFIGIRTPWTLSSDEVWDRTHTIGGKLFKAAGVITILGAFFSGYAIFFILIPVIAVSVFTIVYSYIVYQRQA